MSGPVSETHATHGAVSITCSGCGQPAATSRRFCGNCGTRLWEPCLKCGARSATTERFCPECGSDLKKLLDEALAEADRLLQQAATLDAKGSLQAAIDCLVTLPPTEHSVLAERREQIEKRRGQLSQQRSDAIARMETDIRQAEELALEHKLKEAVARLEGIPASIRSGKARSLLGHLQDKERQIDELDRQIRTAVKAKKLGGLLPKVERICTLQPHNEAMRRLRGQLEAHEEKQQAVVSKKMLKEARDALAANEYDRAARCMSGVNESAIPDAQKLIEAIRERIWLAAQLRHAPYADARLLAIARRLVELQPKDPRAKQLEQEVTQRLEKSQGGKSRSFVRWAKQTGGIVPGVPIEPITSVHRVDWDRTEAGVESWSANPRRHLVALGLALHGIGDAGLAIELKPPETSWLNRLTELRRKRSQTAWGLDLGSTGLRAVCLVRDKDAIRVKRSVAYESDLPEEQQAEPDRGRELELLKRFAGECQPGGAPLIVGLPGEQSLGRFYKVPKVKPADFRKLVQYELRNQIPLSMETIVEGTQAWEPLAKSPPDDEATQVVTVAARRVDADRRKTLFSEAGLRTTALQSECIALLNSLLYCYKSELEELGEQEAIALIEVGVNACNVVAISHAGPWFRTVHQGIHSLDKALVEELSLPWRQADRVRRHSEGDLPWHRIDQALEPAFESLTQAVRHALQAFQDLTKNRLAKIYVAGGGADQYGLLRRWAQGK